MSRPSLAVVMPNYNHAKYLPEAIESILGQTQLPDEFLILDDASTDNSLAVIEPYAAQNPVIRVIRAERNQGVNAAHRRLFEEVRSDYILPMAADDARYPNCCELALSMAQQYPQAGLIIGKMVMIVDEQEAGTFGVGAWQEPLFAPPERYLNEFLLRELPSHSLLASTIFRREPFREVGWYCDELGPWGDTFAAIAIGLKYGVCYVPERFARWRKMEQGFSQSHASNPRRTLDMVNRATHLMRSDRFRPYFPERFTRNWSRRYRWRIVKEYWRGDNAADFPVGASLWGRYRYRLPRTLAALSLWLHHSDPAAVVRK